MKLKYLYMTVCLLYSGWGIQAQEKSGTAGTSGDGQEKQMMLTLQQTVEMARSNSPSAVAARHTFRSAYWNYRSFKANYLPSLSISSNPELTRSISKITLSDGSDKYVRQNMLTVDGSLTLNQNIALTGGSLYLQSSVQRMKLYDANSISFRSSPVVIGYNQSIFGYNGLKWDKKIEPIRYQQAKKTYVETLELVSAEAVSKFFALARAQSDYEMACFNYANADTLYQFAKGRYEIGTITENELLHLEITRLTESTNKMDASIEMDNCRQALCTYLGLDKDVILNVITETEVPHFEIEPVKAYRLFAQNSPDMESLDIRLLQSRSAVAQARSNTGLKADLYVQYGLSQTGEKFGDAYHSPQDQQQVSIGISLPILDWGRGRGRVKVAKSSQELTKVQVEQERNSLEMNVRKMVLQFNLQSERVEIAYKTDITARRRHEVARKLYLLGKSSVLDLNSSISEKDSASRSFLSALSTYWNLYYMLRSMTLYDFQKGEDIEVNYMELVK